MRLFVFVMVGFAITNSLVFLHIFEWFRRVVSGMSDAGFNTLVHHKAVSGFRLGFLGRLVRCHACMGFWVGFCLSLYFGGFIPRYMEIAYPYDVLADSFFLSGTNFVLWIILRKLGAAEL